VRNANAISSNGLEIDVSDETTMVLLLAMTKPVARLQVSVESDAWKTLVGVDEIVGLRPFTFVVETGYPAVWLYYVGNDEAAISQLVDARDNLPCKSGGELRDWADKSNQYFNAAVRVARAKAALDGSSEGSERHTLAANEYSEAVRQRDQAAQAFEAALASDAEQEVQYEEFERQNSERLRFLHRWT